MKIIHLVSSLEKINFGIWNSAAFAAGWLRHQHQVSSSMWVCSSPVTLPDVGIPVVFIGSQRLSQERIKTLLFEFHATPADTVVVSHGCWGQQTRLGAQLRAKGFQWIYTPHGMLEPWSLKQKALKKKIYFALVERRLAEKASVIRAVGEIEKRTLQKKFKNKIVVVENGVTVPDYRPKPASTRIFLFMARLHHKKGIVPLVKAWREAMDGDLSMRLIIAGPDEGELPLIQELLTPNIQYVGPVYGEQKENFLLHAHYYVLPSYSEGFPTSVVEAMSYGAIPVISEGCNLPVVFSEHLGFRVAPDVVSIASVLRTLKTSPFDEQLSRRNHAHVVSHNSEDFLGEQMFQLYASLLKDVG